MIGIRISLVCATISFCRCRCPCHVTSFAEMSQCEQGETGRLLLIRVGFGFSFPLFVVCGAAMQLVIQFGDETDSVMQLITWIATSIGFPSGYSNVALLPFIVYLMVLHVALLCVFVYFMVWRRQLPLPAPLPQSERDVGFPRRTAFSGGDPWPMDDSW